MKRSGRKLSYPAANAVCVVLALVFLWTSAAAAGGASPAPVSEKTLKYLKTYEYDHSLPLNVEDKKIGVMGSYTLYHLLYDGLNGERVPANLYIPVKGGGPFPCVIVQHGYNGDKSFAGMFANILAPKGYALIAIDIEYHGERKEEGKDVLSIDVDDDVRSLHQTVTDLMRTIDYLETRKDIDTGRIGYTGASLGGFLGAIFSGVDKRVKTSALIVGGGGWETMLRVSKVPCFDVIRDYLKNSDDGIKAFAAKMEGIDPLMFIGGMSPRPLLMLNCENDRYVPKASGEALYAAAGEPKDIKWYTCSGDIAHVPPIDKTTVLIKKWFDKYLK